MKKLTHFSSLTVPIVILTIFLLACKTSKKSASTADDKELSTKFEKLYIEACTQYNIGNYTIALAQFNKCSDIKPKEASVYFQISRIKQNLNEGNAAFQNASKANALEPSNKFYAYHYGRMLRMSGDFKKASEVLQTCINFNPNDENLYLQLDEIYALQKETNKQIDLWNLYRKNVGLKSKTGLKLIELYKRNNDITSAHRIYEELKSGAPNKVQFYIEDAKLYESQKDETNAMANYEKAMTLNPNNWEINYALFQFYDKKREQTKASKYLTAAFINSTVNFETQLPACLAILKSSTTDSSNCNYSRIAANGMTLSYSKNAKALYTSGELFYACGDYNSALKNFEQATSLDANLFDAWMGSINCCFKLHEPEKAIAIAEKAMEFFPNTVTLYEKSFDAYSMLNQYSKALEVAMLGEKFCFDNETKSQFIYKRATSYYQLKKYNEAQSSIEEAIVINQSNGALYDLMGNIYFKQANIDKAIENWTKAKDLGYNLEITNKKIHDKNLYE